MAVVGKQKGIIDTSGRGFHFSSSNMASNIGLSCKVPVTKFDSLFAFAFLSRKQ